MSTFGIEEEFFMLDAETGLPASADHEPFRQSLDSQRDGEVQNEFLACQVEHASSVCEDRTRRCGSWEAFAGPWQAKRPLAACWSRA